MLKAHWSYLKEKKFPILLPGEPLPKNQVSLCLTFDDAYFDFYHHVFPLLKSFNFRALLGVPVRYIQDSTNLSSEQRLSVPYHLAMQDGIFDQKAPLCTWKELKEMVDSGHVEVANHSYSHANLSFPFVKLEREVLLSKEILEDKLQQMSTSYIYPFGRFSSKAQRFISEHYPYVFRIGSAANFSWHGDNPLCRISADQLKSPSELFSWKRKSQYALKALIN